MLLKKIKFYGRRKGRKLSKTKIEIEKLLGPKIFLDNRLILEKINKLSGKKYLEIGFGSGENIIKFAQKHSSYNFIGAELYVNSYVKVLKKIYQKNIKNLKIIPDDVRLYLHNFKNSSFNAIFLLHPDPWPKNKHIKRRLLQQSFIDVLSKILKKNGLIIIATDQAKMKSWVLEQFHVRKDFIWKVKDINKTFVKPKFFEETKYSRKSKIVNNTVNWFFFKKK